MSQRVRDVRWRCAAAGVESCACSIFSAHACTYTNADADAYTIAAGANINCSTCSNEREYKWTMWSGWKRPDVSGLDVREML